MPTYSKQAFLVYGAGTRGKEMAKLLQAKGAELLGFIDANAGALGRTMGLPVHTLRDTLPPEWRHPEVTVAIAVLNPLASIPRIIEALKEAGFARVLDFYGLYRSFAQELGDLYWLSADPDLYQKHRKQLADTRALFADEKSKALLDQIIEFRSTLDLARLPEAEGLTRQYFADDIPLDRSQVHFIDCGAFDGDSAASLGNYFEEVTGFDCFEPDPANHAKMVARLEAQYAGTKTIRRYHLNGVTEKRTILRFHAQGAGGALSDEGELSVDCVALDEVLPAKIQNAYLKMDIEGAELEALRGAERLLLNNRVCAAICVYHRPEDLWTIPAYLKSLHPDYRFYLRLYGENLLDTVLYALR